MPHYGGMGGLRGGRPVNPADRFEAAVERALGAGLRSDASLCRELWCALANQTWCHDNGDTADYSFRAAGDLVAAVRGSGDYLDWYCSGPDAWVSERIRAGLAAEGWRPAQPLNTEKTEDEL